MKKLISVLIILSLLLTMSACEKTPDKKVNSDIKTNTTQINSESKEPYYDELDGTHIINDAGDEIKFAVFADSHVGQSDTHNKNLQKAVEYVNSDSKIDFTLFLGDNIDDGYFYSGQNISAGQLEQFYELAEKLNRPYYAISGNHDANTTKFEKDMVIKCGDIAIIGFFANYYTFDPEDMYTSNGMVSMGMLAWLESVFEQCKDKKIILACHYSIVEGENFYSPIPHAQPVPKRDIEMQDFGREKILELAEKYGAELYLNGHEHQPNLPVGTAGTLTDFNIGSLGNQGLYAVVTIKGDKAIVELKNVNNDNKTEKTVEYVFKN